MGRLFTNLLRLWNQCAQESYFTSAFRTTTVKLRPMHAVKTKYWRQRILFLRFLMLTPATLNVSEFVFKVFRKGISVLTTTDTGDESKVL